MRAILRIVGAVVAAFGLLFIGQGAGVVRWPESSFMIDRSVWMVYGTAFVIAGIVLILSSRLIRR